MRSDYGPAAWRDWVARDHRLGPAAAAFRLDAESWLSSLPERRWLTAELLAEGHGTLKVSRQVGVRPQVIAQARAWLERSWLDFPQEATATVN